MFNHDSLGLQLDLLSLDLELAPIDLLQQIRDIICHQVGDLELDGLLGWQACGFPHRFFRPFDVAPAHLRKAADVGDRIVDDLLLHGVL